MRMVVRLRDCLLFVALHMRSSQRRRWIVELENFDPSVLFTPKHLDARRAYKPGTLPCAKPSASLLEKESSLKGTVPFLTIAAELPQELPARRQWQNIRQSGQQMVLLTEEPDFYSTTALSPALKPPTEETAKGDRMGNTTTNIASTWVETSFPKDFHCDTMHGMRDKALLGQEWNDSSLLGESEDLRKSLFDDEMSSIADWSMDLTSRCNLEPRPLPPAIVALIEGMFPSQTTHFLCK
jgi:hypothetical protein